MPWNCTTGSQMISSPSTAPMAPGMACISSMAVAAEMACFELCVAAKSWRSWSIKPPAWSAKFPLSITLVRLAISSCPYFFMVIFLSLS